jgi:FHS family Na+ dependent glucose MFS transporter 1
LTARFQTFSYFAAFIALGLTSASMGPTLPWLADQTGTDLGGISLLFTTRSLGYMVGSFWSGRWYDRLPGHRMMAVFLAAMGLCLVLIPLMPTLALLAAVLAFLGMAEGVVDLGGNTLLVWVHGLRVAPFMNALHFFFGVGSFITPIIIAQVVAWGGGIRWAFWVLALWMVPTALSLVFQRSPSFYRPFQDPSSQDAPSPGSASADPSAGENPAGRVNAGGGNSRSLIFLISLFFFLIVGSELSLGGWIYTYTVSTGLGETTMGAYITSAFWGALTLGRLAIIPLARWLRPWVIMLSDLLGAMLGVVIMLTWRESPTALWVGVILAGFSLASLFPTPYTFAGQRLTITGRISGWFYIGISLGSMTLPWVIGQLFESSGPQAALWVVLGGAAGAVGVLAALMLGHRSGQADGVREIREMGA